MTEMEIARKRDIVMVFSERERISCDGRLRRSLARDSVRGEIGFSRDSSLTKQV